MHSDEASAGTDGRCGALLALFAHPDDEFAIFPWLQAAIRGGRPVVAVWLTDGGWGGQDIQVRQDETIAALKRFGVGSEGMHFLGARHGAPDGRLHECLDRVLEPLWQIARQAGVSEVMAPAWEGGHQDHDAAHLAAVWLLRRLPADGWEFSLYNGWKRPGPLFSVLSLIPRPADDVQHLPASLAQRLRCASACLCYRSQWKSFVGLLPFYLWRLRSGDAFARRPIRPERTAARPHPGALLYERRTALTWEAFAAATARFRAAEQ